MNDATIRQLLEHFQPSSTELINVLNRRVDDSMLHEIAQADYGDDAAEHLIALKHAQSADGVAPVNWVPIEVLELIRFSRPNDPTWKPGSIGERGHLMRALCCAILLRTAAEPGNYEYFDGENLTIVQLIDSALELDDEAEVAVLRFLSWRILTSNPDDTEYPFFAMAILLLASHLQKVDDDGLIRLVNWLIAEESRIRNSPGRILPPGSSTWLLGLTFDDLCHDVWTRLTEKVLLNSEQSEMSLSARQAILDVAYRILGASG